MNAKWSGKERGILQGRTGMGQDTEFPAGLQQLHLQVALSPVTRQDFSPSSCRQSRAREQGQRFHPKCEHRAGLSQLRGWISF